MTRGLGLTLTPYGKIPGGYAPYAIDYDYAGATNWYGSASANEAFDAPGKRDPRLDPQFFTAGEAGYYYDTALGRTVGIGERKPSWFERARAWLRGRAGLAGFPTDFQLATIRGYLPVEGGWVSTEQGYMSSGPWLPPHSDPGWANPRFPVPMVPRNQALPVDNSGLAPQLGRALAQSAATPPAPATVDDVVGSLVAHNDRVFALALVSTTAVAVSALLSVFRTLKLIREDARD